MVTYYHLFVTASRALRSAHMAFTLSSTMVSVAVLGGTGKLGTALLRQLEAQKSNLEKKLGIGVCVNAIASSTKMRLGTNGQCLTTNDPDALLGDDADDLDMDALTLALEADVNPHRVIIDCTNCDRVADKYPFWMASGINVISPNRNAGSGPIDRYNAIRDAQRANSVEWQYESSVGSALPILTTLRDLMQTGDDVHLLRGCLSGTMAYIFSAMSEEVSFTDAVREAMEQDFTENDIREDLTGADAASKIVILARELGMDISVEDVEIAPMLKRWKEAVEDGLLLRYKFVIDVEKSTCRCSLDAVTNTDTLYRLRNNENLVAFETTRYSTSPLIVKGAAAGPELAAAGMFADLLRLGRAFSTFET
jgi:aspartokinase/homoserine dehydrogenase 1